MVEIERGSGVSHDLEVVRYRFPNDLTAVMNSNQRKNMLVCDAVTAAHAWFLRQCW